MEYNLIISGTIGAGKSTLVDRISEYLRMKNLKVGVVNEYITSHWDGPRKLSDWITGRISLQEFEDYIAACMRMNIDKIKDIPIKVFDRTPFESSEIFCKDTYCYKHVAQLMKEIHEDYKIPYPCKDNVYVVNANEDIEHVFAKVKECVDKDLQNGIHDRIIYLRCNVEQSMERIKIRGREPELSYPHSYLLSLVELYDALYLFIQ